MGPIHWHLIPKKLHLKDHGSGKKHTGLGAFCGGHTRPHEATSLLLDIAWRLHIPSAKKYKDFTPMFFYLC